MLLPLLSACGPESTSRLAVEDYGMSLSIPKAWNVTENVAGLRLLLRPQDRGGAITGAVVTLTRAVAIGSHRPHRLDAYVDFKTQQAQTTAREFSITGMQAILLAGEPAQRQQRDYASRTQQHRALMYFTVHNGNGYTLSASTHPKDSPRLRDDFDRLAASWRWHE